MSAAGFKRTDHTGRTSSEVKTTKRTKIKEPFAWRAVSMMTSPAFRALPLTAHRVLARLEIEIYNHGGRDNGALVCTYQDFAEYGCARDTIASAVRILERLGFLEVVERGRAGNGEWRRPAVYRLTYRPTGNWQPTDEWRAVKTDDEAAAIIRQVRDEKQNASPKNGPKPVRKTDRNGPEPQSEKRTTRPSPKNGPLSKSPGGEAVQEGARSGVHEAQRSAPVTPDGAP
ncbi:hypothetical protein FKB34_11380 [Glycocaulis profundi]|nr:hypothetical protein FKB34_11380 [Glycocaulis profundi]